MLAVALKSLKIEGLQVHYHAKLVCVKSKPIVEILCERQFQNLSRKKKRTPAMAAKRKWITANIVPEDEIQGPVRSRGLVGNTASGEEVEVIMGRMKSLNSTNIY